jgi:hypothetical protein
MKKMVSRLFVATLGATAMYFFDPDRGHARRARAQDQLAGFVRHKLRRATKAVEREVHYAEGRAEGLLAKATGAGHYRPESQVDLREHLKQVIAELDFSTTNVNVDVSDGVATLRGQVEDTAQAEAVVAKVGAVLGVERVENFLHLPGEPAPNKASALEATGHAPASPSASPGSSPSASVAPGQAQEAEGSQEPAAAERPAAERSGPEAEAAEGAGSGEEGPEAS